MSFQVGPGKNKNATIIGRQRRWEKRKKNFYFNVNFTFLYFFCKYVDIE